ncbi:transposase [Variovorax sp. HW608]|uniref:IS66-like element accessory protein TnpA n=1 Tax=Variovorax sp. HW608 TaxID=1034889 RepID=UPI0008200577|nr:transposase [Variovorax sp. HW608]SCK08945.1 transposase [Variovorax sp. HW608]SCK28931.1 transposase [Variovorax sp. HW608]SCK43147.1 transposase [Variovorax sp. HW608]
MYIMKSEAEPRRRHHDRAFKAKLVEQSMQPGASASAVAREHGINANLLFTWRREHARAGTVARSAESAVLLPVRLAGPAEEMLAEQGAQESSGLAPATNRSSRPGVIELELAGAHLRLRGTVDEASLCSVLRALRQSA